ncbi:MAG: flagellar protein FlaG [Chitinispirillales bacterium]|nr:flagellar protein FlaG [Chitinispirillales bacterium]
MEITDVGAIMPTKPMGVGSGGGHSRGDGVKPEVRGEPAQARPAAAAAAEPQLGRGTSEAVDDKDLADIMEQPVKQANNALKAFDRKIERSIHEVTKTVMYVIRDTQSNEVIAEYPPRKIQDMIAKMWELAGLFVDERA